MCGIAGIHLKDTTWLKDEHRHIMESFVDEFLLGIESRGKDATGFLAIEADGNLVLDKRAQPATDFIKVRKSLPDKTRTVLLHTRFATQGHQSNYLNNHPVNSGSVFVTHNGTISNDDALFRDTPKIKRAAEVDSEIIAALINKHGIDDIKTTAEKLRGGFAVAAVDILKPGKVRLFKGSTWPLVVHENKSFVMWASTESTLNDAWEKLIKDAPAIKYISLGSGDVVQIDGDKVELVENAFKPSYSNWNGVSHYDSFSARQKEWWNYTGDDFDDWKDEDENGSFIYGRSQTFTGRGVVIENRKRQIESYRAVGKGRAVVYGAKGQMTKAQKKRYNGKWAWCPSCRESVMETDIFSTSKHGRICIDCRDVAQGNENSLVTKTTLSGKERDSLEEWAILERQIYTSSVSRVALTTGLKPAAIEYLIYRAPPKYLDDSPQLKDLVVELSDLLDEAEAAAWDDYASDWEDEDENDEPIIRVVHSGGIAHDKGADCDECDPPACGVQVEKEEYTCQNCKKPATRGKPHKCGGKKSDRCMRGKCKKKANSFIGLSFQFCGEHANKCAFRGCKKSPVGTAPDTRRLCHQHCRSEKGGIFDGDKDALNKAPRANNLV